MRGARVGTVVGALFAALIALVPASALAADPSFRVGAARVDVTPPPFDPTQKNLGPGAAACPPEVWTGPRPFDFEEPYQDGDGSGRFDYPEPYCDLNGNGRWDGIWASGGPEHQALGVREDDRPSARALAVSDGDRTVVIVSVSAEGIFENYVEKIRAAVHADPALAKTDVIVSADHNESTPDTVGINGGPDPFGIGSGLRSGIDDFYMNGILVPRVAQAAADAVHRLEPATLWARNFRIPAGLNVHLSNNWPTTEGDPDKDPDSQAVAIDPKVRVLQARDANGAPIATMMNLAAHNQEIGHSDDDATSRTLSADWPGYFERKLESTLGGGGLGMYLVGANGSEEDPHTVPKLAAGAGPGCPDGCFEQARATGEAWAAAVARELPRAQRLRFGPVGVHARQFCVPLENNLFKAAVAGGLFGERQTYTCEGGQMVPTGSGGSELKTEVSFADVGPDLQVIANPGEAFPALMLGSPFGIEDAPCDGSGDTVDRSNPLTPTWRARAAYRFQAGLANDMIGYLLPGWAFVGQQGNFTSTCDSGSGSVDAKGHQHKLESEGVGPTASNQVANELSALLLEGGGDPVAEYRLGRFVRRDGTVTRRPSEAVAVWLARPGAGALTPGSGTVIALPGVTAFGGRSIDGTGRMMDYDGAEQPSDGDLTTRGMLVYACDGSVARRIYLDLYPTLANSADLGPVRHGGVDVGCGGGFEGGGPGNGPGGAGGGPPQGQGAGCADVRNPLGRFNRRRTHVTRRRLTARGRAADRGCAGLGAVLVSMSKPRGLRCRFVRPNGRLTGRRSCRRPVLLRARGRRAWRMSLRVRLPRGRYRMQVRAVDRAGNKGKPDRKAVIKLRVR